MLNASTNLQVLSTFVEPTRAMADDAYFDQYDYYNFGADFDKLNKAKMASGGGHAKNKKIGHTGNDRKMVVNIQNSLKKEKQARQRLNSV